MSLMYSFKGFRHDGSQYCHPCEGPYEIVSDQTADVSGHFMVIDKLNNVHLSTRDFLDIFIENADGKTINRLRQPWLAGQPYPACEAQGSAQ